jgi:hypothetical protein
MIGRGLRGEGENEQINPTPGIAEVTAIVNSLDSKTCHESVN